MKLQEKIQGDLLTERSSPMEEISSLAFLGMEKLATFFSALSISSPLSFRGNTETFPSSPSRCAEEQRRSHWQERDRDYKAAPTSKEEKEKGGKRNRNISFEGIR